MVNVNMPPVHANEKWKDFDWDDLAEEPYRGNQGSVQPPEDDTKGNIQGLSEKDMEHLERLRGMVEEMRRNAASIRIKKSEDAITAREQRLRELEAKDAQRIQDDAARLQRLNKAGTMTVGEEAAQAIEAQRQEAYEEVEDQIDDWVARGAKYIPESRQAEWKEHITSLAKTDPASVKDRVEGVLSLMEQLGDDKIELADFRSLATDQRITEIARDFRKDNMEGIMSGLDLGSIRFQKVDEHGNRLYDKDGNPILEEDSRALISPLTDRDRGILEDLVFASPQGARVFRKVWPEQFWDEHDQEIIKAAEKRNADDHYRAREAAEASGELKNLIKARQKRQMATALDEWNGNMTARKRMGWLSSFEASSSGATAEEVERLRNEGTNPADYWEQKFMNMPGLEQDDIEATIEVMGLLNERKLNVSEAIAAMDDYELDEAGRQRVRAQILYLHPRGPEFYERSSPSELSQSEKDLISGLRKVNELIEPGINDRLKPRERKSAQRPLGDSEPKKQQSEEAPAQTLLERTKAFEEKNAKRNAKEASDAQIRIELEEKNVQEAKATLANARQTMRKHGGIFASKIDRERSRDDYERAKKAYDTAVGNLNGAKEILQRARRGEM